MPRTNPAYDEEFKVQAVELLLSSNKGLKTVARELGVCDASLRKWKKDFLEASGGLPVAEGDGMTAVSAQAPADTPIPLPYRFALPATPISTLLGPVKSDKTRPVIP